MGKRGPKKGAPNAGRPLKEIDQSLFEKYCRYGGTLEEIADYFECDADTINAWCKRTYKQTFSEVLKKHGAFLNLSLRRAQLRSALGSDEKIEYLPDGTKIVTKGQTPSIPMQIWLGKQRLGQTDQPVDESKPEKYQPLQSMSPDEKTS